MSIRPEQPEPFLRGCVFPAVIDAPYPRADPAGAEYLPADVWDAAQLPVGVRLELAGNARTVRVWYKTTRASLGYRGESAGCSFVAYRAGQKVATVEAVMGEGMAELVMSGRTDQPVTVYLPEGMVPMITGVAGVEQTMTPAPLQPRWLAYGDAVTQGWLASAPAMAWPAVAGRKLGLDVCNLGYAGTARGETTSALLLAETPAEAVSIAFGLNNWSRVPHTAGLMAEEVRCFLSVVRQGHPDIPVVVVSPTARPEAEDTPNRVGATLAELRRAMEETVLDTIAAGDEKLFLVEGLAVVGPEDLEDGMYPGDEGHRRLAAAVAKVLLPHLTDLQERAEKRWATEGIPATPDASEFVVPSVPAPPVATTAQATGSPVSASLNLDFEDFDSLDPAPLNDALDALAPDPAGSPDPTELPDPTALPDMASLELALLHHPPLNGAAVTTSTSSDDVEDPPAEMFPVDTAPVDTAPVDTAPVDTAPVDTAPVDTAPVDTAPVDTAPVDTAPVDTAPVDTAPVDTAPADDPELVDVMEPLDAELLDAEPLETEWLDTELPDIAVLPDVAAPQESASPSGPPDAAALTEVATNGHAPSEAQREPAHPTDVKSHVRRDTTPVDIEIADMVVAALTLATNGADDVIFGHDEPVDELRWAEAVPTYELQWPEGTAPAPGRDLQWAEPKPTDEFAWTDPDSVEELQWAETADPGAY